MKKYNNIKYIPSSRSSSGLRRTLGVLCPLRSAVKEVITYNCLNYLPDMQHHKQYISDEV